MRAWLFQDSRQLKKLGEGKCPWSVGYYDPDGKKRSRKIGSRSMAEKYARKLEGQLASGTYQANAKMTWMAFRKEYEQKRMGSASSGHQRESKSSLDHFERLCKPGKLASIKAPMIDGFIAKRRKERGQKAGSTISPATVNRDLRYIKAALRCAEEWEYIPRAPRIKMLREPEKLVRYVTPEHFEAIYSKGCKVATRPSPNHPSCRGQNFTPEDWWKALVVFLYMTGWRIDSALSLRWEDIDAKEGTAFSRHEDNKGKRDQLVQLHPIVLEHLERIRGFGALVFAWPHDTTLLYKQFRLIQEGAVDDDKKRMINLPCRESHEHTPFCSVYGFHDFRRAFATANAETLSADALQRLMQHKSYLTTQRYINMAHQVKQAAEKLHVPDVLKKGAG